MNGEHQDEIQVSDLYQNLFKLRRPSANYPFLKQGAIELASGRLDGIVKALVTDDHATFHCHKMVHSQRTGGQWGDNGNTATASMCAGERFYLEKLGRPRVRVRVGPVLGMYSPDELAPHFDVVIEPTN